MSATRPAAAPAPVTHIVGGAPATEAQARSLPLTSPWDGSPAGAVPVASPALVASAIAAAERAAVAWAAVPLKDRVQPLFAFKRLAEARIGDLAAIVSAESGKTVAEAEAGIRRGLEVVEYACSLPSVLTGEMLEVSGGVDCHSRRLPLGVVAGITPFNFPAMVPLWMIPTAIACGNAFVLKPSEQVPRAAVRLAELFAEAGLPPGVLTVLHGDRSVSEAIIDHPAVAAIGFVGSTPAARAVHQRATALGKRALALGGAKNHLVVVPDADVQATAKAVVASAFGCAGQRCMAASVMIAVGDTQAVVDAVVAEAKRVRLGTDMGAMINRNARDRAVGYLDRAASGAGARLLLDGRGATVAGKEGGHWLAPSVIEADTAEHESARDEIFAPVLTVLRAKTLDEAIAIENRSPYGNAASLFTASGAAAARFEAKVRAGMVGINVGVPVPREPFAFGGWNDSKFGTGDMTGQDGAGFWTKARKVTRRWAGGATNWMS